MKKKIKLTRKQVLVFTIVNALCAAFWIYDAISYAGAYFEISKIVGGMPSPWLKVAAAGVWFVAAIVWLVRYIKYDDLSKDADECVSEE